MTAVREWLLNLLHEYRGQHGDAAEIDLENPDFLEFATIKAQQDATALGCQVPHIPFNDYVQAWYFKAMQPVSADPPSAPDGLNAQLNQRSLCFTNAADAIEMMAGNDSILMGGGQDLIALGPDQDAITFGGTGGNSAAITFDANGASSVNAAMNCSEFIRSQYPDTKQSSELKIASHEIVLSSHGGDVIIELLPEY